MIIIDNGMLQLAEEKKVLRAISIDMYPLELKRDKKVYEECTVRKILYREEFWLNDDKSTAIELAFKTDQREWSMIMPFGDLGGGSRARVTPNDVSYIKTRF